LVGEKVKKLLTGGGETEGENSKGIEEKRKEEESSGSRVLRLE